MKCLWTKYLKYNPNIERTFYIQLSFFSFQYEHHGNRFTEEGKCAVYLELNEKENESDDDCYNKDSWYYLTYYVHLLHTLHSYSEYIY